MTLLVVNDANWVDYALRRFDPERKKIITCVQVREDSFVISEMHNSKRAERKLRKMKPSFLLIIKDEEEHFIFLHVMCKNNRVLHLIVNCEEAHIVHEKLEKLGDEMTFKELLKEIPKIAEDMQYPFAVITPDDEIRVFGSSKHTYTVSEPYFGNN